MNILGVKPDTINLSPALADDSEPVQFLDFTIDGEAVSGRFGGDLTSLTNIDPEFRATNLRRLAGESIAMPSFEPRFIRTRVHRWLGMRGTPIAPYESAFADGRIGLAYCFCGDMDCGVISTRLEMTSDRVTWHQVGWQVTYEPFEPDHQAYLGESTFTFERHQYDSLFRWLLEADWSDALPDPDRH